MSSKIKSGKVSFDLKRFAGIKRDYTKEDVEKLKGTFDIEYSLCKSLSEKLSHVFDLDRNTLKLMGKAGRENVIKKFNVEKMCFSTYSEYKKLLN